MGDTEENQDQRLPSDFAKVLKFYRENESKGLQLSYQQRMHCTALVQQAHHGPLQGQEASLPALGALDVIGKDRRRAWADLGSTSKHEAMQQFITEVTKLIPEVKSVLDPSTEDEADSKVSAGDPKATDQQEGSSGPTEAQIAADLDRRRQEDQRRQIQDALNRQTFSQFKSYAETQFPNNPDQQAVLIRQLQEQHYHQYMQQVYQQQMQTMADETLESHGARQTEGTGLEDHLDNLDINGEDEQAGDRLGSSDEAEDDDDSNAEEVSTASMWTKKELDVFKSAIRKEGGDSIIKVGHGETVTIRVPTHDEGTAIFWEFATDSYDIAFGLFFEWEKSDDENEVSVHISDSEDEDLGDEDDEDRYSDPEAPGGQRSPIVEKGPPTSVIVPIYRRDCHQEVYAGSHQYPGQGVYLLKFDNSYSLWRSKTLYYRVFYTK